MMPPQISNPKTRPPKKAPITTIDLRPACRSCGSWCCHNESIYFSPEELAKVGLTELPEQRGACVFLRDGLCSIWKNRPLECVLFPFDLITLKAEVWWIVWETCPALPQLDIEGSVRRLEESVLPGYSASYILEYLGHHGKNHAEKYRELSYREIRQVRGLVGPHMR